MLYESLLSGLWPLGAWELLGLLALGFLMLRNFIYLANVIWSPKLPFESHGQEGGLVSILIPARNEEGSIGHTLESLSQLQYRNIEVLVLDDDSVDRTAAIVHAFAARDSRFQLLSGKPLPKGWLGKNWACHQLSQYAKGDRLLFIDADVSLNPEAVHALLAEQQRWGLSLLSVFPDQKMETWGEKVGVPMMHQLLLSLLPLHWVRTMPFSSMAAANGQLMLFDAKAYQAYDFHSWAKTEIVEDISIARKAKEEGLKVGVYLGNGLVHCRMYEGYASVVDGFSKNLLAGFGGSILGLLLYLSLISWAYIPVFFLPMPLIVLGLLNIFLTNISLAWLSNQNLWETLLTHPFRVGSSLWIGIQSIKRKLTGKNEWKGRNIQLKG